jgi:hypothetical protein
MLARHAVNLPNSWPKESHIFNELTFRRPTPSEARHSRPKPR